MLIVVLLGLVGALAWAGAWVHEVWTSVPGCNADFADFDYEQGGH